MTLLREIQEAATDDKVEISTVLRKAKILAARLGNADFEGWVNRELNGYGDGQELPSYRELPVIAQANLRGRSQVWDGAPIMSSFLPEKLRWWAETNSVRHSIASVAAMVKDIGKGHHLAVPWPQEMAVKYGAQGYNGFECVGAWQIINPSALIGIVDTVRNRILEFALKIERENPDAGEASVNAHPVPPEKIQPLVQNIIYGSVGNIAQSSEHFNQTANIGLSHHELEKLVSDFTNHLDELRLDARQKQRAEVQIASIKTELNGEPDATVVRQAGRTLRNITEGAIAGLISAAIQPTLWTEIHNLLSKF